MTETLDLKAAHRRFEAIVRYKRGSENSPAPETREAAWIGLSLLRIVEAQEEELKICRQTNLLYTDRLTYIGYFKNDQGFSSAKAIQHLMAAARACLEKWEKAALGQVGR